MDWATMASWLDIEASDQAFLREETIVCRLTELLGFDYVRSEAGPQPFDKDNFVNSPSTYSNQLSLKFAYRVLPYALGFPAWNGEIALVCVSNMSEHIFWPYVTESFGLAVDALPVPHKSQIVISLSEIQHSSDDVPHVSRLRLLYSKQAWNVFEPRLPILCRRTDDLEDRHLALVHDSQALGRTFSALVKLYVVALPRFRQSFRGAYLSLRHWSRCNGILSSQLKMLTNNILLRKYVDALHSLGPIKLNDISPTRTADKLLAGAGFLAMHDSWNSNHGKTSQLLENDAAFKKLTSESMRAIGHARSQQSFCAIPSHSWASEASRFWIKPYEVLITVNIHCWVPKLRQEITKAIPDILLKLQTHLRQAEKSVLATIWPYSVSDLADRGSEDKFILGVYTSVGQSMFMHQSVEIKDVKMLCESYFDLLSFDHEKMSIDYDLISAEQALRLMSNSEDEQTSMETEIPVASTTQSPVKPTITDSERFRTAASAMSRLLWDPVHSSLEYEVGYTDRFQEELMWKPLDQWQKATEEEDFIPEHRIHKIRRKNGKEVWNRQTRVDSTG